MNSHLRYALTLVAILMAVSFFSSVSEAARIFKVKGRKVLVLAAGDDIRKGDKYYVVDGRGKRRGLIKIVSVRGNKAIAQLKGRARKGWGLEPKSDFQGNKTLKRYGFSPGQFHVGGTLALTFDSMDVSELGASEDQSSSLSGSGYALKGFADYRFLPKVWFRLNAGLRQFEASSGDEFCGDGNNESCKVSLTYITIGGMFRYLFSEKQKRWWIGAGGDFFFPMADDVTAIESDSVSTSGAVVAGFGFDYFFNKKMFLTTNFDYSLFPSSNNVETSSMSLRGGVGWRLQ
jgi:hypothetical protein